MSVFNSPWSLVIDFAQDCKLELPEPVEEAAKPVGEAAEPVGEVAEPVVENSEPVDEAAVPVDEAAEAVSCPSSLMTSDFLVPGDHRKDCCFCGV